MPKCGIKTLRRFPGRIPCWVGSVRPRRGDPGEHRGLSRCGLRTHTQISSDPAHKPVSDRPRDRETHEFTANPVCREPRLGSRYGRNRVTSGSSGATQDQNIEQKFPFKAHVSRVYCQQQTEPNSRPRLSEVRNVTNG